MANVSSSNGLEKRPKLRFPGFDEPWEMFKAEDLFRNVTDKNHPGETVLTIIQGRGTMPRDQAGRNIHYDDKSLSGYKRTECGDYIIHLRSFEGGLEMANEAGIVSPAYTILRCSKPHSSLFFNAYFHTDEFINHVLAKSVEGIRDGRQISYEAFKWLGIPYCHPDEQAKIARLFDILEQRIEKQRQLVDALKKYKRGLLKAVFTREVQLDSSLHWERRLFAEIAFLSKGKYTPKQSESIPCVELEHLEQNTGRIIGHTNSSEQNSVKSIFHKGDVLFGKLRPYLRKFALPEFDGVCSSEIWVLCPMCGIDSSFLFYLVQSEDFIAAANISSGTKMPRAEWSKVSNESFFVPALPEQKRISQMFASLDQHIANAISCLEVLHNLKHGLLQQLFI